MSARQRRKGRRGELEVAALLGDAGFDPSLRYEQPEYGGVLGDIESTCGNWEVKRRAALPAWMQLGERVRGLWVRRDRGEWLVLVRASDLLELMADRKRLRQIDHWLTTGQDQRAARRAGEGDARLDSGGGRLPGPPEARASRAEAGMHEG